MTSTQPTSMRPGWLANFGLALLLCSLVFKLYWDLPQDPLRPAWISVPWRDHLDPGRHRIVASAGRSHDTALVGLRSLHRLHGLCARLPRRGEQYIHADDFLGQRRFSPPAQVVLLSLGTSYAMLPALREVRRGFIYRVVRHPVYALYMLADLTLVSLQPSLWNIGIAFLGATTFFLRSTLEEKVLAQDAAYATYRESVPWRFFPGVY